MLERVQGFMAKKFHDVNMLASPRLISVVQLLLDVHYEPGISFHDNHTLTYDVKRHTIDYD